VVAGDGEAYAHVVRGLAQAGARVLVATADTAGRVGLYGGERIGVTLGEAAVLSRLAEADALVLCPGTPDQRFVGPGGVIDAARLASAAPHLAVVGEEADADLRLLAGAGLRCWPGASGPGHLFDLLPQPVIELHTAGLKVGEIMTHARRRGSSPLAAEQLAAAEAHAQLLPQDLGRAVR
jgi:hypothetical protein